MCVCPLCAAHVKAVWPNTSDSWSTCQGRRGKHHASNATILLEILSLRHIAQHGNNLKIDPCNPEVALDRTLSVADRHRIMTYMSLVFFAVEKQTHHRFAHALLVVCVRVTPCNQCKGVHVYDSPLHAVHALGKPTPSFTASTQKD